MSQAFVERVRPVSSPPSVRKKVASSVVDAAHAVKLENPNAEGTAGVSLVHPMRFKEKEPQEGSMTPENRAASPRPAFTLCLPTNRPLEEARPSILSAIAAAELAGGEVIISDNSNDTRKASWLKTVVKRLDGLVQLIFDPGASAEANWLNCLNRAQGKFLGVLSDDDILNFIGLPSFDHPDDVAAVKPNIVVWQPNTGVTRVNNFAIDSPSALERVHTYFRLAAGNNSTYYSFLRTDLFRTVYHLCQVSHPTRGSYIDWAQVLAWVSSGRYVVEPNIVLIYNNRNWSGDAASLANRVAQQYNAAGLPRGTERFASALQALDSFILIARRSSPVEDQERLDAAVWALVNLTKPLLAQATANSRAFSPDEHRILERLHLASDPEAVLGALLRLLDHLDADLARRYLLFYEEAIGAPWGEFPDSSPAPEAMCASRVAEGQSMTNSWTTGS
jgi:hypothetical protein